MSERETLLALTLEELERMAAIKTRQASAASPGEAQAFLDGQAKGITEAAAFVELVRESAREFQSVPSVEKIQNKRKD